MLRKILNNKIRLALFLLLVGLLVLIRAFEDQLFYDPFLDFFKSDFTNFPLPVYDPLQLFGGLLFRYALNSIISLGIIYVLFKEIEMVKFASILYIVFFLILIIIFFAILFINVEHHYLTLFYVRRFLIQPIFVLLFVPGFFYQKQN
ncbi:exosortase F-associated protein [Flavobacterium sp. CG_9.10]|uniref:exosortase F system-associated membrane protein n=1 Tax=Flavobacterium sp. CG_9.10 TaxID=2787729 RepID=UPI0018CA6EDF|nr:exosortase F system-associated protein [Flavobacterium sp. CG_9.10]MBG6110340.1 exosortase F-associated protein [Flavobacterium sp. CG_9.10]